VCKNSSDQFALSLCSYTLQKMSSDSKIWSKSDKWLQRYGEPGESKSLGLGPKWNGFSKNLIRDISATTCPICAKSRNQDSIFARIMSKEMMQINPSTFCTLFAHFLQFYIMHS
jgi:hypothetical protein